MMSSSNEPIEPLIPLERVANILNMSPKSLWRRIKAGQLPVVRDGKITSVTPKDLKHYIATRRSPMTLEITNIP